MAILPLMIIAKRYDTASTRTEGIGLTLSRDDSGTRHVLKMETTDSKGGLQRTDERGLLLTVAEASDWATA